MLKEGNSPMIRLYEEKEIPELVAIWEMAAAVAHPFLSDEFTAIVKKAMAEMYLPNSNTWVFEKEKSVVGFISMLENEIGGLFVLPKHHSQGIGTMLVNHVQPFHKTLEVEVFDRNKIGKPFYQKLGFEVIKKYLHEPTNEYVLRMKK